MNPSFASLAAISEVPEFRGNENLLCFLPTDLLLLPLAWRWRRGAPAAGVSASPASAGRFLRLYVSARLALALVVVLLHAVGVLHQRPLILCAVSLAFGALAYALIRRSTAAAAKPL